MLVCVAYIYIHTHILYMHINTYIFTVYVMYIHMCMVGCIDMSYL